MQGRERLLAAMRREKVDRVPMAMGFANAKYSEFKQRTGETDYHRYFGLDYRHVSLATPRSLPDFAPYFRGRVPDWPVDIQTDTFSWQSFRNSTTYYRMGPHHTAMNEWGEYRIYGDDEDYHEKVYPLGQETVTVEDVKNFPLPDVWEDYRYAHIADEVTRIHADGLAAVLSWEMTIFEKAWRIRGMEQLLMDLISAPGPIELLFDRIAERTAYVARRYAQAGVDIIQLGDDIATQTGMLFSPDQWRGILKPRLGNVIAAIKKANPDCLVFYHSDGVVEPVVGDLIDIGVDILNPIQPECLNVARLKKQFGDRLSFWGGIGVQTVMPFGSPSDVRTATAQLIKEAGPTGLVVSPSHLIERDIPWENVVALRDAMAEFGVLE